MLADVAVGNSWNTKDGYLDFTESDGKCFCMIRTDKGQQIMNAAQKNGYVDVVEMDINRIQEQQSYQYNRRKLEGWRLLPVMVATCGLINYKGLGIWRQAFTADFITGMKNMIGTFKKTYKNSICEIIQFL